jgi:hypothetical protein
MVFRRALLAIACVGVAAAAGCGGDGATESDAASRSAASLSFGPREALLEVDDLPAGFTEIDSAPGDGLCGFRLADLASNGGRATFQGDDGREYVEHVVMQFDGDVDAAMTRFRETVAGCGAERTETHELAVEGEPVDSIGGDEALAVLVRSTSGNPAVRSLTVVVRDGQEIISVATARSDRVPRARAIANAERALEKLADAQSTSG